MVETSHPNLLKKENLENFDLAPNRETSQALDEAAAGWAARMDRAPLSDHETEELETWLSQDARRLGALMRARALFARAEAAWSLEPVFNRRAFKPSPAAPPTRRRVLGWGAGAAAAAGVAAFGYLATATTAYATARGEVRQVPLADGSNLTLNTLSEVKIRNGLSCRTRDLDIRLMTGEALLNLADGQTRDCVFRVGDWRLLADDGSLFISALPERPAQVTVHRGAAIVVGPDGGGGLRITEGRRLVLTPSADLAQRVETIPFDQLSRELAWREGQLAFHDDSLAQAAAAFARYSRQPIVIRDPALASESVSGLFAANNPVGFAEAIGMAFGAPVRVESERILVG